MKNPPLVLFCPTDKKHYSIRDGLYSCPYRYQREEHFLEKKIDFKSCKKFLLQGIKNLKEKNPFYCFRHFLGSYYLFESDQTYKEFLHEINQSLQSFDVPFHLTPFKLEQTLSKIFGHELYVKNETGNVSGSHKARHLMGTLLYTEALCRQKKQLKKPQLAIYSCGNAALAAATVAKAAGYQLTAFVPPTVHPTIAEKLHSFDTVVHKVGRDETSIGTGDPTYQVFLEYVTKKGFIPFSCSGTDNWSNIDGGETLGLELAVQAKEQKVEFDAILIQVGGGALAHSVMNAFDTLYQIGYLTKLPQFFVIQTSGAFPLVRAYVIALNKLAKIFKIPFKVAYMKTEPKKSINTVYHCMRNFNAADLVTTVKKNFLAPEVQETLTYMLWHKEKYMWPWDGDIPQSVAEGILDDVTYDWHTIISTLFKTGGIPVIATEEELATARKLVHSTTSVHPSVTGTSGLAGMYWLQQKGWLSKKQKIAVIITGQER